MSTPRIRLPRSARPDEAIEVRTLIDHPMVTAVSGPGPRDMLARFEARMNGTVVLAYDFANGSAANPAITFHVRAAPPGAFSFAWIHEDGRRFTAEGSVRVG
ncbi:MAG: thiosulfate oxidation carrier complex protein SoxZ [Alkalilacustris sp.]